MNKLYKVAIFNVGPIKDDFYLGQHTYGSVLFPFINECVKNEIEFTWIGEELVNRKENDKVNALLQSERIFYPEPLIPQINRKRVSNDLLEPTEYDALLLQCRPNENIMENMMVNYLIEKFTKAGVRVLLWHQDLFPVEERWKKHELVTHLLPYTKKPEDLKNYREFLFSWARPNYKLKYHDDNKLWDFIYLGNVYARESAAKRFFSDLDIEKNAIFGNWIDSDKKKEFSSQFTNLHFFGSTMHSYTLPLINAGFATVQILPEFASELGLQTARTFTAVAAGTLCFCDKKIYGWRRFFPEYLGVENGKELSEKIKYLKANPIKYKEVLEERDKMMSIHHVSFRAAEFRRILEELCGK